MRGFTVSYSLLLGDPDYVRCAHARFDRDGQFFSHVYLRTNGRILTHNDMANFGKES